MSRFREAWKYDPRWQLSYWLLYNNLCFGADTDIILRCRIYLASALVEYAKNQNLPGVLAERKRSLTTANQLDIVLYSKWEALIRW